MSTDINKIRAKLDQLNNKNKPVKENKTKSFYKPELGKENIRIVPNKFNKDIPFTEVYFHYGINNKTICSPRNWGEKDPIDEFANELRKGKDWMLAKDLDSKMRAYVPVVVRGKENEGVKLWGVGKTMYIDLLNLFDNEDVGDYTDIVSGRDLIVTTVGPDTTGTTYNKSTVMPKMKESPLVEDKALLKKLLNEQPSPLDLFDKYSYDEIKEMLKEHLTSSSDDEGEDVEETPKAASGEKFEKLFKE